MKRERHKGPRRAGPNKISRRVPVGPTRQSPSDAPADAIERVSPRLTLERGDVALIREALPRVNPTPISTETQWRYRVCVEGEHGSSQFFNSFAAAAARAEEIATERSARLLFVEDGVVSLLADYRRSR